MTALRLPLPTAGLLMCLGFCTAQDAPTQFSTEHVDLAKSPEDTYWGQDQAWAGNDAELPAEVVEHGDQCNCGEKPCHGVCRNPGHPKKPKRQKPGDVDRGDCPPLRYRIPDCKRAGKPHRVAKWAKCGVDDNYSSWFVGGGAAFFRGQSRQPSDGTWGLDYNGLFGHANVWLKYTRDRKQGGEGVYDTDGEPKFISRAHKHS